MKWRITGKTTGGFTLETGCFLLRAEAGYRAAFRQAGPKHPAILPHDGPSVDPRNRPIRFAGFSPEATLPRRPESLFVERAPLRRHVEAADCGAAAAYLLSDDAKNVSGTTLYVDAGYHAMGM